MSRRVLFVHTTQGERLTGGPRMIRTLLEGLDGGPLEPQLVTQCESDLTRAARDVGTTVELLPLPAGLNVFGGHLARPGVGSALRALQGLRAYDASFARLLARVRPSVVWATNLRTLLPIARACRAARVPLVWNIWLGQPSRGIVSLMNAMGIRAADRIVTEYRAQAEELFGPGQLDRARPKLVTVYTGHDIAAPAWNAADTGRHRFVVGTLGALSPRKDPRAFLEMAAQVRREIPGARFRIGGDAAAPEFAPLARELRDLARAKELDECLEWTGWTDDPLAFLRELDVYVQTSRAEGLPGAVREAMGCAKPVVATDVGGTREAVADGETGFLTPAEDPAALAAFVVRLAKDPELARRMGSAGRERFERCFSAGAFVRNTRAMLEEAAQLSATRPRD